MLREIVRLPSEIGYGLFPWWKGSGGAPWQFLSRFHLDFIGPLSDYAVGLLTLYGFVQQFRKHRSVAELHFVAHCLMLAVFFVAFQYLIVFIPYFYLWLFTALQPLPKLRRAALILLLLPGMAKSVVAFWLFPTTPVDRDARWGWVTVVVPQDEAVHYLGLENYAFAPLRWFDTRRMALGVTEEELRRALDSEKPGPIRWLSLPQDHALNAALKAHGWKRMAHERFQVPPQEFAATLSDAQRNFLRLREGPQTLWKRPD
jgi:hypothetical protein